MPEISRFFGIRIVLFFHDHAPPHFHAIYEGRKAAFDIHTLQMTDGALPPRARAASSWNGPRCTSPNLLQPGTTSAPGAPQPRSPRWTESADFTIRPFNHLTV
jgi:hypothetical protein